jgi:Protein of unknown function (DUF2924)
MLPGAGRVADSEIASLLDLDLDGLCRRWKSEFGRAAPTHLTKALMARVLAYRVQADRLDDLSVATVQMIEETLRTTADKAGSSKASPAGHGQLPVGTTLVREHDGTRHHVQVLCAGFAWNGTIYPSLTKVAHAITGTNWNGPRFFGLRGKRKAER